MTIEYNNWLKLEYFSTIYIGFHYQNVHVHVPRLVSMSTSSVHVYVRVHVHVCDHVNFIFMSLVMQPTPPCIHNQRVDKKHLERLLGDEYTMSLNSPGSFDFLVYLTYEPDSPLYSS